MMILLLLFLYDCYFNNFLITKIFYYLPFYIVYNIWYNVTEFLTYTRDDLNRIMSFIHNPQSTPEENAIIENYLRRNLICLSEHYKFTDKRYETYSTFGNWIKLYNYNRRFVRSTASEYKDRYFYFNSDIGVWVEYTEKEFLEIKNSKVD